MMVNSLIERIQTLDYSEQLSESANVVTPALRVYMQSDTALRIFNVADLKLKPFRGMADFMHLTSGYNSPQEQVIQTKARRDAFRNRLTSLGLKLDEIKQVAYSEIADGEIYAIVVEDKKLDDKNRHNMRTDEENATIEMFQKLVAQASELQKVIANGDWGKSTEANREAVRAMQAAMELKNTAAYQTADLKKKLKDSGRDYVYFIMNKTRDGKRGVSTVYESQLPSKGNEFVAYKVVIGTKNSKPRASRNILTRLGA